MMQCQVSHSSGQNVAGHNKMKNHAQLKLTQPQIFERTFHANDSFTENIKNMVVIKIFFLNMNML